MQEHPVPQNITSYEFHLIGDMTVKQFFELLIGGALALLSYTSNLPYILKWPLVIFSVVIGIALAFVPIEERPLDKWFFAFIKAIYNPTKFFWKKERKVPEIFTEDVSSQQISSVYTPTLSPQQRKTRAQDYISSISSSNQDQQDDLFQAYQMQALSLQQMFDTVSAATGISAPKKLNLEEDLDRPSLHVTTHTLSSTMVFQNPSVKESVETPIQTETKQKEEKTQKLKHVVNIPIEQPTKIEAQKIVLPEEKLKEEEKVPTSVGLQQTPAYVASNETQATESVRTNKLLPFPKKPTIPNLIVGMVLDEGRNILDNAIVEIHSQDGIPVRAMKTNMLGQFSISTPLKPGTYSITAEKDNHTFEEYTLTLTNKIVDPIEIQAKA